MGTFSGGGFGGTSGDAFSQSGSSGAFGSSSPPHHHHRNDPFYSNSYNDPYYNNQRPYRESRSSSDEGGASKGCSIVLSFFTFFGSLWMLFGLFKSDQAQLGLNYSRVIKANSVFVKQIEIRNLRDPGPVVYSFSKWPALTESVDYSQTRDVVVGAMYHQEWGFWLNQGSTIQLSYDIRGLAQEYLVLVFIRGREGLDDWTRAPNTPAKALKWYRVHGKGVKDFVADSDNEYYVAFGNLNRQDTEVGVLFNIHSTLYSPKGADKKTVFTSEIETTSLSVPLFGSSYALLTSPSEPQDGVDIWEVAIVYTARWTTYFIIWGTIVAALVVLCGIERGFQIWPRSREELPLLAPRDEQTMPSPATSYPPRWSTSTPPGDQDERGEGISDDHQLCTVCLDAPKDCFFDPCGHRCSCYSCGRRIQRGDTPMCPICRQPIRTVRKIFDS